MDEWATEIEKIHARIDAIERQLHKLLAVLLMDEDADDENADEASLTLEGADAGKARKDDVL
jgi:hypothetical protein